MKRLFRVLVAMAAVAITLPSPASAAPGLTWDGAKCDVLGLLQDRIWAMGEDGYRWDFLYMDGPAGRGAAYAYLNGARVEIHVQCPDQRT